MLTRLSIRGLYNYDNTIFDKMLLPPDVNKEDVIHGIFSECSELATAFPDAEYCKEMIASWSYRKLPIWKKLSDLIYLEYNPIQNYDRYQDILDETNSTTATGATITNSATAYNSNDFRGTDKAETTGNSSGSGSLKRTAHLHGNIGVTTVAQMIAGELETLPKLDIVEIIVQDFANTFCIGIY